MVFCISCGSSILDTDRVCPICGVEQPLEEFEALVEPQIVQAPSRVQATNLAPPPLPAQSHRGNAPLVKNTSLKSLPQIPQAAAGAQQPPRPAFGGGGRSVRLPRPNLNPQNSAPTNNSPPALPPQPQPISRPAQPFILPPLPNPSSNPNPTPNSNRSQILPPNPNKIIAPNPTFTSSSRIHRPSPPTKESSIIIPRPQQPQPPPSSDPEFSSSPPALPQLPSSSSSTPLSPPPPDAPEPPPIEPPQHSDKEITHAKPLRSEIKSVQLRSLAATLALLNSNPPSVPSTTSTPAPRNPDSNPNPNPNSNPNSNPISPRAAPSVAVAPVAVNNVQQNKVVPAGPPPRPTPNAGKEASVIISRPSPTPQYVSAAPTPSQLAVARTIPVMRKQDTPPTLSTSPPAPNNPTPSSFSSSSSSRFFRKVDSAQPPAPSTAIVPKKQEPNYTSPPPLPPTPQNLSSSMSRRVPPQKKPEPVISPRSANNSTPTELTNESGNEESELEKTTPTGSTGGHTINFNALPAAMANVIPSPVVAKTAVAANKTYEVLKKLDTPAPKNSWNTPPPPPPEKPIPATPPSKVVTTATTAATAITTTASSGNKAVQMQIDRMVNNIDLPNVIPAPVAENTEKALAFIHDAPTNATDQFLNFAQLQSIETRRANRAEEEARKAEEKRKHKEIDKKLEQGEAAYMAKRRRRAAGLEGQSVYIVDFNALPQFDVEANQKVAVRVLSCIQHHQGKKKFTLYETEVKWETVGWTVFRRYGQWFELDQRIKKYTKVEIWTSLPEKEYIPKKKEEKAEKEKLRVFGLNEWAQELMKKQNEFWKDKESTKILQRFFAPIQLGDKKQKGITLPFTIDSS
eukprot:TRINITY_DN3982_c0_g1_i1.p1 TRINITY_DN3982_c0_g1~~TRINITY_DN3982_c0_g1_i1.p1  ORF type:complete len:853 (+),score=300.17 TRINITY_DN3982_c0_g1_i1:47-2605(+)